MKPKEIEIPTIFWIILILIFIIGIFSSCDPIYDVYHDVIESTETSTDDHSVINGKTWVRTHFLKVIPGTSGLLLQPLSGQEFRINKVTKDGWLWNYGYDTSFAEMGCGVLPYSADLTFNFTTFYRAISSNDSLILVAGVNPLSGENTGSSYIFKNKQYITP